MFSCIFKSFYVSFSTPKPLPYSQYMFGACPLRVESNSDLHRVLSSIFPILCPTMQRCLCEDSMLNSKSWRNTIQSASSSQCRRFITEVTRVDVRYLLPLLETTRSPGAIRYLPYALGIRLYPLVVRFQDGICKYTCMSAKSRMLFSVYRDVSLLPLWSRSFEVWVP